MLLINTNGQHFTTQLFGHVDVVTLIQKVLIQNGVDVNAVDDDMLTTAVFQNGNLIITQSALSQSCRYRMYPCCTLQLLCFGADIDEKTIDERLPSLRPIKRSETCLSHGNRMETSFYVKRGETFHVESRIGLGNETSSDCVQNILCVAFVPSQTHIVYGPGYDLGAEVFGEKIWVVVSWQYKFSTQHRTITTTNEPTPPVF